MPPEQPVVSPTSVQTPVQPQPPHHNKTTVLFSVVGLVLLLGAFTVYAYVAQVGPFERPPYNTAALASSVFSGIAQIHSAGYSLSVNVVSEQKDADAVSFQTAVPYDNDHVMAYKRDQDRVRALQSILGSLRMKYGYLNKVFPATLTDLGTPGDSKSVTNYQPTNGGKDFNLTVVFETSDAVDAITKTIQGSSTTILGTKVTFTKGSSYYFYMPTSPKEPMIANIGDFQSMLAYVPAGFSFNGALSGASVRVGTSSIDGKFKVVANVDMSDTSIALDVEARKIADNLFIVANKFPSFFVDISKLKTHWVKFTQDDLAVYGAGFLGGSANSTEDQITEKKQQTIDGIKLFLSIADTDHALISQTNPVKETVNGTVAYRYDLGFNKEVMATFYKDISDQFSQKFGKNSPFTFDQATLDYLKSPQFGEAFDYLRKNTTLSLWADQNGVPIQVRYSLRVVPNSDQKNSDRQVRLTLTLSLTDINKPVTIDTPKDAMSVEDATILLTGQSKEQFRFNKQSSAVQTVRAALDTYKQLSGSYPKSLSDLTKTRGDVKKLNPNQAKGNTSTPTDMYYSAYKDTDPILRAVPVDTFTGKAFDYVFADGSLSTQSNSASVGSLTLKRIDWMTDPSNIPTEANSTRNTTSDIYYNPRVNFGGIDAIPYNDTKTATEWCKTKSHQPAYVSGESFINFVNPQDGVHFKYDGSKWIQLGSGDYPRYYVCSTQNATDYLLTFTQQFPPYTKGSSIPMGVYSSNYMGKNFTITVVDGVNTADSKHLSKEAAAASLIDSDGDGLPDMLEKYIGTDPNKKDTDGDGYSDYQELTQGSDPLGPGNLKRAY